MAYEESEYLQLSGIQHFAFCRRQWALIHVEQVWAENLLTVKGDALHQRVHDDTKSEKRGAVLTVRAMFVSSSTLGFSGQCDVVEFREDPEGITLHGRKGTWQPYPIEYKRGSPKKSDCDRLQLCAQAICLEEMLECSIPEGALFYGETKRRQTVEFDTDIRERVAAMAEEMHRLFSRKYTPKVKVGNFCRQCSLNNLCLPKLMKIKSAAEYLQSKLCEETLI